MNRFDLLAVVEAAYDLGSDDRKWLLGLANAAGQGLDTDYSVVGTLFELGNQASFQHRHCWVATREEEEWIVPVWEGFVATAPPGGYDTALAAAPGFYLGTHRVPESQRETFRKDLALRLSPWGIDVDDHIGLIAPEPSGSGVAIVALQRKGSALPQERELRVWSQAASHIGSALRLRRSLAKAHAPQEAVLEVSGKCVDAEPAAQSRTARDALRESVRAMERARGPMRRKDPQEALSLWRGLCAGRWSLVDRFDSDSRRFVVALRNDPRLPIPSALTARERQVVAYAAMGYSNKLMAYALGLSGSTVASHLTSALRKLRVSCRAELIQLARAMAQDPKPHS